TPLTITVMQNGGPAGGVQLTGKLSVTFLPEFPTGTTIATSSLAPLYSQVNTNSNVTFTGDSSHPAIIRPVSSIKIVNIGASGGAGGTGSVGKGGPGGCDGGDGGMPGGCAQSDGGGGGAAGSTGGGGAGFSVPGGAGGGASNGGAVHGNSQVVNYAGAATA